MCPSVLVVGAGGNFGTLVMNEFIRQKPSSSEVASLTDPTKKEKFVHYKEHGINTILGSYFDLAVYKD